MKKCLDSFILPNLRMRMLSSASFGLAVKGKMLRAARIWDL